MNFFAKFSDYSYALMRMVVGFMFSFHGVQKIFGILSDYPSPAIGTQMWFGGLIELIGGFLIMVGFKTRWAAFITSGMMAVAYFQFHWKFQFNTNFFPAINQGEPAVLYCFIFLYIACKGSGIWSLEKLGADQLMNIFGMGHIPIQKV